MQVEQRVLVRGAEGEQGTAVSAPDFDNALRARLDARAESAGSASGPRRIQDREDCSSHISLEAVLQFGELVLQPRAVLEEVVFARRSVRFISFSLSLRMLGRTEAHLCCARRTYPASVAGRANLAGARGPTAQTLLPPVPTRLGPCAHTNWISSGRHWRGRRRRAHQALWVQGSLSAVKSLPPLREGAPLISSSATSWSARTCGCVRGIRAGCVAGCAAKSACWVG
mgnify:CR=1 FL=1